MSYSFPIKESVSSDIGAYVESEIKALVVASSELDRVILKKILHSLSFKLLILDSGNQALEALADFKPDIVFMNLNINDKCVFDLTKKIKQRYSFSFL